METEVNFYFKLVPELAALRAPMPKTFPVLWGDYKSTEKEILLLENLEGQGFTSAQPSPEGIIESCKFAFCHSKYLEISYYKF